jgi:hypothetical protein
MRGEFYTERDIVDLVRSGARQLEMKPGDRMTDLARDRANKEGLLIVGPYEAPFQAARLASAVRYSQERGSPEAPAEERKMDGRSIQDRVSKAVKARLGDQVDSSLLDRVIQRVLEQVGLK